MEKEVYLSASPMGSQSQSQEEEQEKTTTMTMKKRPFAEIDGGEFGIPSPSPNPNSSNSSAPHLPPARSLKLGPSLASTSSPTSAAAAAAAATTATYTELDHGRISKLEKMIRVLKSMHSSLRRDYWTSPPTCDELRMYHLILIHVNSYISLFHIEQSSSSDQTLPLFPKPKQGEEEDDEYFMLICNDLNL